MQTIKLKLLLVTFNNVHNLAKLEKENNQRGKWKHKIALMDVKEELVVKLSSEIVQNRILCCYTQNGHFSCYQQHCCTTGSCKDELNFMDAELLIKKRMMDLLCLHIKHAKLV